MGNSEDLEEYDAELELALKREYADVFSLFRYCVITAEATYLCNKLEMDCVPHASYLLFELDMEDVWLWDRNRPTRIIPRAHVYTTADVTVEQLKEAVDGGADLILLDNMGVEQIRECVGIVAGRAQIEASGGVTLANVRAIAEAGVDFISVGRLTHSAPALDISFELGAI